MIHLFTSISRLGVSNASFPRKRFKAPASNIFKCTQAQAARAGISQSQVRNVRSIGCSCSYQSLDCTAIWQWDVPKQKCPQLPEEQSVRSLGQRGKLQIKYIGKYIRVQEIYPKQQNVPHVIPFWCKISCNYFYCLVNILFCNKLFQQAAYV